MKLLAEREAQLEKRDGVDDQLREELEISQGEATTRGEALDRTEAQLKTLTEANKEQAERLAQAQNTMSTDKATLSELQDQLVQSRVRCDQEAAARKAAKEAATKAAEMLDAEKAERASLVELLDEAGVAASRVQAEHAAIRDELVSVQAENAALKTKVDSLDLMVDSMNSMGLGHQIADVTRSGGDSQDGSSGDGVGESSLGEELERDAEQDRVDIETKMLVLKSCVTALIMERDDLLVETRRLKEKPAESSGYRPPTRGAQAGAQWGAV